VVVWDGAGRNVLAAHPRSWPHVRALMRAGTSYANATVGSSPSVTSAIHATLGTGAFPQSHGITGNDLRMRRGQLRAAFAGTAADALRLTTFADEIDLALGNDPKVGLMGWTQWHLGMMGHGASLGGADRDEVALIRYGDRVRIFGDPRSYTLPTYLEARSNIQAHLERLDRADGRVDQRWLEHDISLDAGVTWTTYSNPAWAYFQSDLLGEMLQEGSYGRDAVPDLMFVNFKMVDLVGHQRGATSEEAGAVLAALDQALFRIVGQLERRIEDYVVLLTADHGHSSLAQETGAWPILQEELVADIDAHFGVPEDATLVEASPAHGLYLDPQVMQQLDVDPSEVASFLNEYTISDNWDSRDLPAAYRARGNERVFSAAFTKAQLPEVMRCAFGKRPPR